MSLPPPHPDEATFARFFDLAPLFMAVTSLATGKFIAINDAFVNLSGYTREEALGRSAHDLGLWADSEVYSRGREELGRAGELREQEVRLRLKSGEVHTFLLSAKVIELSGEPCILNAAIDITWRAQAEARVRESESRYRTLFNSTDEGFCVIEVMFERGEPVDYRFLEANPRFEQQTGLYSAVGKTARHLVPDLEPHWFRRYGAVALGGEPQRFESGSGAMGRWFDVYAFRVDEPAVQGAKNRVGVLFKDITERKRAEVALAALNRELEDKVRARTREVQELAGQLTLVEARAQARLAQVLHDELQQQLYAVQFALRGLRSTLGIDRADTLGADHGALQQLDEVKDLVGEAVAIARTTTANLSPPVLRHEGLVEALRWLGTDMAARHGLRVRVEAAPTFAVPREAVRVLLFQLVRELLFNVVKHAGVDEATVRLSETGGRLELSVADLGAGFDPRALDQAATGFGLLGVRRRLELFGGELSVVSAPNKGTRVAIVVPAEVLTLG
jgi:PAS domain S-box-containing protein